MQGTLLHVSSSSLIVRVCICLNMCLFVCLCLFRELFALLEVVGLPKLHKMCVCDDGFKHSYVFKTKDPKEKCTYCKCTRAKCRNFYYLNPFVCEIIFLIKLKAIPFIFFILK